MATLVPPPSPSPASEGVKPEKTDYMNLPRPVCYEHLRREALGVLKADHFEGMRVDFTKQLNQRFSLSHSIYMGSMEVPSESAEIIRIPSTHYVFSASFVDPTLILVGRVAPSGRVNARVKCELSENLTMHANAQLTNEPHVSHVTVNFDYKGTDCRTRLQFENGVLLGASYMQSVTPHLSLGGKAVWDGQCRRSGVAYAARYNTDKMVASGLTGTMGLVELSYVQKVSKKVSLASDLRFDCETRDVIAAVGYEYILRQCRLRGKLDSNGRASAFLEKKLYRDFNLILSAELDHKKKDYRFGFGCRSTRYVP